MKKKAITICSSASFYEQALAVRKELIGRGFHVLIPHTVTIMEKSGDFNVSTYKTWYKNASDWSKKAALMKKHFRKIVMGDAVLVLNYEKKGEAGYIGGNVLMEMALAFHYKKPIFILHPANELSPLYEEIMGMQPILLRGNLADLTI